MKMDGWEEEMKTIRHMKMDEWEEEMKGWWGLIGMTVICAELTDL